jgi:CheY-like chemotaxis protein
LITIRDTGIGISHKHLNKVFDPFFTTKPGCSGLGLSSSYAIIVNHGGHIDIMSEEGVGTTLYLYLPALCEVSTVSPPLRPHRTKTILLVEEDTETRETTASLLQEFGYTVVSIASGLQAVEVYQAALAAASPFDVVILDLSPIGREGGRGCLKALLEADPNARIIGGSRYADSLNLTEYRSYGFAHVAKKPYNIDQLIKILRSIMTDPHEK